MTTKGFYDYNRVAFDLETSDGMGGGSLDERKGSIALMQVKRSPHAKAELLDPLDKTKLREVYRDAKTLLEDPNNLIIGHNLKFDYKWLADRGIFIRNIFDTMIASQLLYAGFHTPDESTKRYERGKKTYKNVDFEPIFTDMHDFVDYKATKATRFSNTLAACVDRELGISISKAEQKSDWGRRPLSKSQVEYALSDVLHTHELADVLYKKLVSRGLEEVFWLEMETLHALAFTEYIGLGVDKEKWKAKALQLSQQADNEQKELQKELGMRLAIEQDNKGLYGYVPILVNLNSPVMAEHLRLPNVKAQTLIDNESKDPFITKFLAWKGIKKLASTYGTTYLDKIGKDGRLRGDFSQTFTSTGRLSSRNPNLQNCPTELIKSMVVPAEGTAFVAMDYATVELRILAYLSGDEKFIEACNSKDMHAQNARTIFDIAESQEVPKHLRKKAKVVSFAVPYGTSAHGLFNRGLTDTIEEAQELISKFYNMFPKVAEFLRSNADMAAGRGFTRDAIGRVRNYELPTMPNNYSIKAATFKEVRKSIYQNNLDMREIMELEYEEVLKKYKDEFDIKELIGGKRTFQLCKEVSSYDRQLSAIKREGQNMPIQSSSASITKRALADTFYYLMNTGYGFITLSIHDSIMFEIKLEHFRRACRDLKGIMEEAGEKIVPGILTPVDIDVGEMKEVFYKDKDGVTASGYVFTQKIDEDYNLINKTEEEMLEEAREQ